MQHRVIMRQKLVKLIGKFIQAVLLASVILTVGTIRIPERRGDSIRLRLLRPLLHKRVKRFPRRRVRGAQRRILMRVQLRRSLRRGIRLQQRIEVCALDKQTAGLNAQVASYGMTADEMVKLNDEFMRELRPLYLQLHTWTKYKLAAKYHQPVPDKIPAHWINNRWAQNWTGLVEAADLDPYFKGKTAEWIAKTAEAFYTGLGLQPLPASFWVKSDLYPVPPGNPRKKNTHASCWHIDLDHDIRSLQSIEPNAEWFFTAHHELGHGHYFLAYTRPEVPPLLRTGAAPGFHEGIGELIALASIQVPYLQAQGILPNDFKADKTAFLLDDALARSIPFIFFASGTMTHWEADIYAHNLEFGDWNERWWDYVSKFQGVEPPEKRSEDWADYATKTHIDDTPAYYYNYAVATVLKFQLHDYIARKILHQPPQSCNYAGKKEVGAWLQKILEKGGTEDWRKVLKDATGEELSTRAMVEYFKPLMSWLEEQNKGRKIGWTDDRGEGEEHEPETGGTR